ncbi:putative F-box domain-containing protein [Helianthus annuus]|nr:putative F-box domain-containing protein [Helianthus annuus]
MSDDIPFELQEEIIKRVLPVKSLIRFRSVSKQWKSLIDSSEFITHHTLNNKTQPQHLLVRYITRATGHRVVSPDACLPEYKYVSIVDDDSFPHHNFSPVVPPTVKLHALPFMLDCSHGLVCLYGWTRDPVNRKKLVVVWNPLIGKSVCIEIPDRVRSVIGFGVCPKTSDPKIVKLSCFIDSEAKAKAEVFTLSSGAWRSVPMNIPFKSLHFWNPQVVRDGVIHWLTYEKITYKHRFYLFDLASEKFGEAGRYDGKLAVYELCSERINGLGIYGSDFKLSSYKESLLLLNHSDSIIHS